MLKVQGAWVVFSNRARLQSLRVSGIETAEVRCAVVLDFLSRHVLGTLSLYMARMSAMMVRSCSISLEAYWKA